MNSNRWAALAFYLALGCGDDAAAGGAGNGGAGSGGGDSGEPEPLLNAACMDEAECPDGYGCFPGYGCYVECPTEGPGADNGCPSNGFCAFVDMSPSGICSRVCESDADCTAVNPELTCQATTSTESFDLQICSPD